jgi:hypothetical protein
MTTNIREMMQEITNMLVDLGGNQTLPSEVKIQEDVIDQSKIMQTIESNIDVYVNGLPTFAKSIHDKVQKPIILKNIMDIIDAFDFEIKESYKLLWQSYILNNLSDADKIIHINKVKSKIVNKKMITYIENEIRTPSKATNIIKKILFSSLFVQDEESLTEAEIIIKKNIAKANEKYHESVIHFLDKIDFTSDENLIVNQFFNCVRLIEDDNSRNTFYNSFLTLIIAELKKPTKTDAIERILLQVYLYLINNETIKTVNPDVVKYVNTKNFDWFSYQITQMPYQLYPHWNFKTKEFILDMWQKHCIQNIYLKMNILLSLPTSAGKTVISTAAIRKFKKIWYIVPTEPLALQLAGIIIASLMEIEKRANETRRNVKLAIKSLHYKRFMGNDDIIIATPDELFNLISQKEVDSNIDYVIIDEFHNMANNGIGKYIEGILLFAAYHQIPTICLSATIPNFNDVKTMMETRFNLPVFGVSEKKRFFNIERFMIKNLELIKIDPLNHISIETLRSNEFTHIGLPPKDVYDLYQKLMEVTRINEKDPKFLKLDDVHKLECDIFSYLKTQPDEVLSKVIACNPIIDDQLSIYDLFLMLKKFNTSAIKPMIIFTMDSQKCMDRFNKLLVMVKEYESLIYDGFQGDQPIIQEYFDTCEELCKKIKVNSEAKTDGDGDEVKNMDYLEEKKNDIKDNVFEGNPGTKFKPKDYYLSNGFAKNDNAQKIIDKWLISINIMNENKDIIDSLNYENYNEFIKSQDKLSIDEINDYLLDLKIEIPTEDNDHSKKKIIKSESGTVFALIKFYIEFVNRNIEQKFVDDFNTNYGSNLTVKFIKKLRNIHAVKEFRRYSNRNGLSFRNKYAPHSECRLIDNDIPPEQMRKIKRRINNELHREILIQNQIKSDSKNLDSNDYNSELIDNNPDDDYINTIKVSGKDDSKVEKEELSLINYDHPFMRGLEFGILGYNKLMNPALQRVSQYLINKYPFITFSDESLAVGINYPIKTVMLLGGLKGEPLENIDNALAHQAIGRAGRRGLDIKSVAIYSGVVIEDILIQKYKHIVPNNIDLIKSMFSDTNIKNYLETNVRPPPPPPPAPIVPTPKPIVAVKSQTTITTTPISSKPDILSPDYVPESWEDYEDWEAIADAEAAIKSSSIV